MQQGFGIHRKQASKRIHDARARTNIFDGHEAWLTARKQHDLPNFARCKARSAPEFTFKHEACADASANPHRQHILAAARSTERNFAPRRDIHIVVECDSRVEFFRQQLAQRNILPTEIACFDDDPIVEVHRAWRTDADAEQFLARDLRVLKRTRNAFAQALNHANATINGLGLALAATDDFSIRVNNTNLNVGATKIDADHDESIAFEGVAECAFEVCLRALHARECSERSLNAA